MPAANPATKVVELLAEISSAVRNDLDIWSWQVLIALRTTGCRPAELRRLIWEWADFDSGFWILPDHEAISQQRQLKRRIVPLPVPVRRLWKLLSKAPTSRRITSF